MTARIWEIDFLRGLAILLMVAFHTVVDLTDFYNYPLQYLSGPWYVEGKLSAILFMFLAGVSSTLSAKTTRHGLKILTWGIVLTALTYMYDSQTYIRFGILHFLGASLLSAAWIKSLPIFLLAGIAAGSFLLGNFTAGFYIDTPYLLPLGLVTQNFISLDYYPLFPWYGVFLLGIVTGKKLYFTKQSRFVSPINNPLTTLGQHSLSLYLLHQPVILMILYGLHQVFH